MVEALGLTATGIVLLSFLLKGEKYIRLVNIIGAVLFVIYGYFITSLSNMILNSALVAVHLYRIFKINIEERKENENINNRNK